MAGAVTVGAAALPLGHADASAGTAQAAMPAEAPRLPAHLPALRQDLQLHPAAPQADGAPSWHVQDPVGNRFYRIGWLEFELLSRWALGRPQDLLAAVAAETPMRPQEAELQALFDFLLGHGLLEVHDVRHTEWLIQRHAQAHRGAGHWLLHHYLFFRLPLLHPAAALQRLATALDPLFQRGTAWAVGLAGLLGVLLTARRWDEFHASFLDTLSWGGLAGYLIALALTKGVHELGHALVATRRGLRVAHMGLAFVVMWPMLYTDTSESWKLADRRARLAIASAGLAAELGLAAVATLAWHLVPEGSLAQQGLFYLATTAWVVSLALNLSPFMRFDGYYILSDLLDLPNLHERSFALARHALRRTLWGWRDAPPEVFAPARRRALILFAWAVWLYRLTVFIGIAVAVYLFFFKLLGLALFALEIAWFVWRPMRREFGVWAERRAEIPWRRRLLWGGGGAALLLAAALPWPSSVHAEGWAHPQRQHVFYSPLPARLVRLPAGDASARGPHRVAADSVVFELAQPELAHREALSALAGNALAQRLRGLPGETEGEALRAQVTQQHALREAEVQAWRAEAGRLMLAAPFAGVLVDADPELAAGSWVGPRQPLATLVDPTSWQAEAFVSQDDRERLRTGDAVRLHVDGEADGVPLTGRVIEVDTARTTVLPHALLSARHGGALPVLADADGNGLTPRDALYRVRIALDGQPRALRVQRGHAVIEGEPRSWLAAQLRPAIVLALRELSF